MSIYYPGWVMRVYYDIDDGDPIMQVTTLFSYNNLQHRLVNYLFISDIKINNVIVNLLQKLCDVACRNSQLDICNVRQLPGTPQMDASNIFPMVWRFFPTIDRQVPINQIDKLNLNTD